MIEVFNAISIKVGDIVRVNKSYYDSHTEFQGVVECIKKTNEDVFVRNVFGTLNVFNFKDIVNSSKITTKIYKINE